MKQHFRYSTLENSLAVSFFFFFKINLFIYLFLAVLGLCFCVRAFSSSSERGPLFIAVSGPLTAVASPIAEHRLQTRRLSSCGSRAQPLCGMWDLPRPGLEPMSPALAGRFSTTAPPGKPRKDYLKCYMGIPQHSVKRNLVILPQKPILNALSLFPNHLIANTSWVGFYVPDTVLSAFKKYLLGNSLAIQQLGL